MPGPAQLATLLAGLCCALVFPVAARGDDDLQPQWPEFTLTERNGRTVTRADLLGHVCVASFVFTRCPGPCPQVTRTVSELQGRLLKMPGVLLVTFTVDPDHDDPGELTRYATAFGADPNRWLFLTGSEKVIYDLMEKGLRIPRPERPASSDGKPRPDIGHSTQLVVIDAAGKVQGFFDGLPDRRWPDPEEQFQTSLRKLRRLVAHLAYRAPGYLPQDFPAFNATLNAASAVLLLLGYAAIRGRNVRLHAACMLTALAVSAVFLASYLYYHLAIKGGQPTYFQDEAIGAPEWMRYVYLGVLLSHTILAVAVAPLALTVAWLGVRGRFTGHVRLARWTLPIWLYVSITGVAVYWMLYRLYPGP
jgi:protein SCO1/2/putative membrane protein